MPAWQIVGLGVGALVLVVIGVMLGRMVPLPGSSTPTPTAVAAVTPTVAAATATVAASEKPAAKVSTPTVSGASQTGGPAPSPSPAVAVKPTSPPTAAPKPTSPPPSPPPTSGQAVPPKPTAPANPPGVLLADNFERAETGQLPRTSARPNDYVFSYDRGEYVINKINAALPAAPIVFLPGSFENTVIAVDVRIMGDVASRYAFVVCRDQSSGGQARQYRASVVPEGRRLILSRWDDGNQRVLSEARDEAAINTGDAKNRLELRCAGAKISAAVNGKVIATADDMTLNRGDHGVGAGTFAGVEGTLEARFDNLEVRVP
jgi:hypothetical protein